MCIKIVGGEDIIKNCVCKRLEKYGQVESFESYFQFIKLEKELHNLVLAKELEEISFHKDEYWERIFKCKKCSDLWILAEPEDEFRGHWKRA